MAEQSPMIWLLFVSLISPSIVRSLPHPVLFKLIVPVFCAYTKPVSMSYQTCVIIPVV